MEDTSHKKHYLYLVDALRRNTLHHAYLLYGPKGGGKKELALDFARFLQCTERDETRPCGVCRHCRYGKNNIPIATSIVEHDESESIKIDDVRNARKTLDLSALPDTHKILIILDAHRMTDEAHEALLKTLEEPPQRSLILLATDDRMSLPKTVLSRCHHLYVPHSISSQGTLPVDIDDMLLNEIRTLLYGTSFEKMLLAQTTNDQEEISLAEKCESWLAVLHLLFLRNQNIIAQESVHSNMLKELEKGLSCAILVSALEDVLRVLRFVSTNVNKKVLLEHSLVTQHR